MAEIYLNVSSFNENSSLLFARAALINLSIFAIEYNLKNSLIIQEQNTKKNHKRVVVLYVIKNHVNLHKL
jgi:hypothetical protein